MAILKRRIFDTFEISDSVLLESEQNESVSLKIAGHKSAIDIYKMEYERCVQRYNDLYNSAWTNFSYMAIIAGGILSFGGSRFVTPLVGFLACLPLLFWWWATFEPLNRYGDQVQAQVLKIENALNALSLPPLIDLPADGQKGLSHFKEFAETRGTEKPSRLERTFLICTFFLLLLWVLSTFLLLTASILFVFGVLSLAVGILVALSLIVELLVLARRRHGLNLLKREWPRVRFRVRIAAWVLLITAICFGARVVQLSLQGFPLTVTPK